MKTIESIEKEISEINERREAIRTELQVPFLKTLNVASLKREFARHTKRFEFLTLVLNYLATGPTNDFITKERDRLKNKLKLIDKHYPDFRKSFIGEEKEAQKEYSKLMRTGHFKNQLKTIEFLLGDPVEA